MDRRGNNMHDDQNDDETTAGERLLQSVHAVGSVGSVGYVRPRAMLHPEFLLIKLML